MKILVVVDMQNDFINGSLGTKEAQAIVDNVVNEIEQGNYDTIYVTRDTHGKNYLETREGRFLPVEHCIENTPGWNLNSEISNALWHTKVTYVRYINKPTFGSEQLVDELKHTVDVTNDCITFVGLCTDICVVSNALMVKAALPETNIYVKADCCAGVTPEKHEAALETMRSCQIEVI